ncbi:hypothetical protein CHELA17_62856 [Chelatococcus asaccharovorans]|nr:hypothetical protein CHELA17_62856 [Chelatococcus asaccharovorans]
MTLFRRRPLGDRHAVAERFDDPVLAPWVRHMARRDHVTASTAGGARCTVGRPSKSICCGLAPLQK